MSERDLEQISQFIDGEMTEQDARAFRERLLAEPALRNEFDRVKAVNTRVGKAFSGAQYEAVPQHITAAVAGARTTAPSHGRAFSWTQGAVAASVLAAAVLMVSPQFDENAQGEASLASVLETAPSRAVGWDVLSDGTEVRPLLSFRSTDGAYCREYLAVSGQDAQRGVACRRDSAWTVEITAPEVLPEASAQYRPANSHDVDAIASYVDSHADGDAMSLSEEAGLIGRSWQ